MAGICGIITKDKAHKGRDGKKSLQSMLDKLGSSSSQPGHFESFDCFSFGNVSNVTDTKNRNFIYNPQLDIYCIVDGLVFVSEEAKGRIKKDYNVDLDLEHNECLPYLYKIFGLDFTRKITGWYNVFVFDRKSLKGLLFNDPLGYLPLYCFESASHFVFASKIESVLASGLMPSIDFDIVSVAEHLFFHYVITDNTYIKNISTLSYSSLVEFDPDGIVSKSRYWTFRELLPDKPGNKKEGLDLIDAGLKQALDKLLNSNSNSVTASLTGGLDSRIVLSYLIPSKKPIHLYSFGRENAPDLTIPAYIAGKENIPFTPYILDEKYLQEDFPGNAGKTILLSNGTRNYKRTHYLFALRKISENTHTIVSGIFGDEVLKISGVKPNNVISKNSIDFIAGNFDVERSKQNFLLDKIWRQLNFREEYADEFEQRMSLLRQEFSGYENLNQKFYHFRFLINLRKFFGAEVNSYNDLCYNFSPFIDLDFLSAYFRSSYCGVHYPFNNGSLLLKMQSLNLYGELVKRNHARLLYYPTDRGYRMSDAFSIPGYLKILGKQFFKPKTVADPFNTKATDAIFKKILVDDFDDIRAGLLHVNDQVVDQESDTELLSLYYWLLTIYSIYIKH